MGCTKCKTLSFFCTILGDGDQRDITDMKNRVISEKDRKMEHSPSLLRRFNVRFIWAMIVFTGLLMAVAVSFFLDLTESSYKTVQDSLKFYDNRLNVEMDSHILSLMGNCSSDPDIIKILSTKDKNEEVGCIARVQKQLSSQVSTRSLIRGFYLYYPKKGLFLPAYNTSVEGYSAGYPFPGFIREYLGTHIKEGTAITGKWFLANEGACILRVFRYGSIYGGAWIDLDNLPGFADFSGAEAVQLITDETGHILYASDSLKEEGYAGENLDDLVIPVKKSLTQPVSVRIPGIGTRVVVSIKQSFSDYYFTILLPHNQFFRTFHTLIGLLIVLILWGILFFISYNRMGRSIIAIPTESLMAVTKTIHNGDIESKVEPPNEYEETAQIIDAFNKLLSEISELRISVYEEQLQAREFELKALKNQVAPHFLINCLNTVFMSAQDQSQLEVTNKIVLTLSDHLRYTLSDRDIVPLSEELDYLANYILLTQYRFPGTLRYETEIDPSVLDAQVFALILLTLTENSVKTGLIMGEPFLIRVKAFKEEADDEEYVVLTHTDSGTGLSDEKLEKYNHILEHPEVTEKGTGIGLYNTAMRLRLLLGAKATLEFANEEGMGLRVTIRFPYMKYTEKGENYESSDNR